MQLSYERVEVIISDWLKLRTRQLHGKRRKRSRPTSAQRGQIWGTSRGSPADPCWLAGPDDLEQRAGLLKVEPRTARVQARRVSVAEIAEEVRADVRHREELLVAVLHLLVRAEELGIHLGVIEAGHRSAIESESARSEHQVGALQAGISASRGIGQLGRVFKHCLVTRRLRRELGQLIVKTDVIAEDGSDRRA